MVMEHLNGIIFHKSGPANKQHTNQSVYDSDTYPLRSNLILSSYLRPGLHRGLFPAGLPINILKVFRGPP